MAETDPAGVRFGLHASSPAGEAQQGCRLVRVEERALGRDRPDGRGQRGPGDHHPVLRVVVAGGQAHEAAVRKTDVALQEHADPGGHRDAEVGGEVLVGGRESELVEALVQEGGEVERCRLAADEQVRREVQVGGVDFECGGGWFGGGAESAPRRGAPQARGARPGGCRLGGGAQGHGRAGGDGRDAGRAEGPAGVPVVGCADGRLLHAAETREVRLPGVPERLAQTTQVLLAFARRSPTLTGDRKPRGDPWPSYR